MYKKIVKKYESQETDMKKSIVCLLVIILTVMPLLSCGGDMIHISGGGGGEVELT